MSLAAVFAFLSVNNADVVAFRYLFIAFTCLQSLFIIIAYVILSKEVCVCVCVSDDMIRGYYAAILLIRPRSCLLCNL